MDKCQTLEICLLKPFMTDKRQKSIVQLSPSDHHYSQLHQFNSMHLIGKHIFQWCIEKVAFLVVASAFPSLLSLRVVVISSSFRSFSSSMQKCENISQTESLTRRPLLPLTPTQAFSWKILHNSLRAQCLAYYIIFLKLQLPLALPKSIDLEFHLQGNKNNKDTD